jgi:hypothetical protein
VNIIWPEWCGRGRTRHSTVITGNLWNVPPTQVGVQSLIASLPVASAWAPQCDQFSFISTSAPSAQASTCWDERAHARGMAIRGDEAFSLVSA